MKYMVVKVVQCKDWVNNNHTAKVGEYCYPGSFFDDVNRAFRQLESARRWFSDYYRCGCMAEVKEVSE